MTALGGFILFVGVLALLGGLRQRMRLGRLSTTPFAPPSEVASKGKAIADPKGSISTEGQVKHGDLLTSPVTKTPCLFYAMKLEAEWKVGESETKKTITETTEGMVFQVTDAQGQVSVHVEPNIHATKDDLALTEKYSRKKFSRGLLGSMTSKPIEVTPHFQIPGSVYYESGGKQYEVPSHANFFITENVLEPKPFFYVNGKLNDDGVIGKHNWIGLLVKEKPRNELIGETGAFAKKLFIGGGVGAGIGAIVLVIGLLTAPKVDPKAKAAADAAAKTAPAAVADDDAAPAADDGADDAPAKAVNPDAKADVGVTFDGCPADFGGKLMVGATQGAVNVSSLSGSTLTGALQLNLGTLTGTQELSTKHRISSKAVINVVANNAVWTNMAKGGAKKGKDTIGGTLDIDAFDGATGVADVTFTDVTLQNPADGSICTLNGRLQTFGTGM